MHFTLPERSDAPIRPWAPLTEIDLITDVSLDRVVETAVSDHIDHLLYNPNVHLKWAHCDESNHNLWTQYADPDFLIDIVYRTLIGYRARLTDLAATFRDLVHEISDILDDMPGHGYPAATAPLLRTDQAHFKALEAEVTANVKHIIGHANGGRVLGTLIVRTLRKLTQAPPNFNFRTQQIHGLPFLNGALISSYESFSDSEGATQHVAKPVLRPYAPEDYVELTRPIQRQFDLQSAHKRLSERSGTLRAFTPHPDLSDASTGHTEGADVTGRPLGWDWLVRGFLGLHRPSEPPPSHLPLDPSAITAYAESPDSATNEVLDAVRDFEIWRTWIQGGVLEEHDRLFEGYSSERSDAMDWFDRLVAATLFAEDAAPFKKLPFIYGPTNTGKSTFFNVIQQLIGPLYGSIANDALLNKRSMKDTSQLIASIMGKRWIVPGSEIPATAQWRSEVVKAYTGSDQLLAERKYENPVEFRPQGGLWVAGNHYLAHEDRDDSMSSRLVYLTFHAPTGRRLTPGEVTRLIAAEADDILYHLACVHSEMRIAALSWDGPAYWTTAHDYPRGFEPDLDQLANETDPWNPLFEEAIHITMNPEDCEENDDLYDMFRNWARQNEGLVTTAIPTRTQFVSRVLKGRPGLVQGRNATTHKRMTRGLRLTPTGQSLLLDARLNNTLRN